jgi:hypothetical protein
VPVGVSGCVFPNLLLHVVSVCADLVADPHACVRLLLANVISEKFAVVFLYWTLGFAKLCDKICVKILKTCVIDNTPELRLIILFFSSQPV